MIFCPGSVIADRLALTVILFWLTLIRSLLAPASCNDTVEEDVEVHISPRSFRTLSPSSTTGML